MYSSSCMDMRRLDALTSAMSVSLIAIGDRCNLLAVVATTVGAPEHVGWASDLSLQVDAVSAGTGQ